MKKRIEIYNLSGKIIYNGDKKNLRVANLQEANLQEANLQEANLLGLISCKWWQRLPRTV